MAMTDEEKKAFEEMKALVASQAKAIKDAADLKQKEKDLEAEEAAKKLAEAKKKKKEADSKKTPEDIQIEIDKTEIYENAAKKAAEAIVTKSALLAEIEGNEFLTSVLKASDGDEYNKLSNADLKKAIKVAKASAEKFKPEGSGSPKKMTMDEAMDAWDKKEQKRLEGSW